MKNTFFWFFVYYIALDRLMQSSVIHNWFGMGNRYTGIIEMIWSWDGGLPSSTQVVDILGTAAAAGLLVLFGPSLNVFTFWWLAITVAIDVTIPAPYLSFFWKRERVGAGVNSGSILVHAVIFMIPLMLLTFYLTRGVRWLIPQLFSNVKT